MYDLPYIETVDGDLMPHADVFAVADYYDVPSLRLQVVQTFNNRMPILMSKDISIDLIEKIFESRADKALQEAVVKFCAGNMRNFPAKTARKAVEVAAFSTALLLEVWRRLQRGTPVYQCRWCHVSVSDPFYPHDCLDREDTGIDEDPVGVVFDEHPA